MKQILLARLQNEFEAEFFLDLCQTRGLRKSAVYSEPEDFNLHFGFIYVNRGVYGLCTGNSALHKKCKIMEKSEFIGHLLEKESNHPLTKIFK